MIPNIKLFPSSVPGHPQNTYEYSEPLADTAAGGGGPVAQPQLLTEGQVFRVETGETLLLPCRTRNLGNMVLLWKKGSRVLTAGTIKVRLFSNSASYQILSSAVSNKNSNESRFHSFGHFQQIFYT